MSDKTVLSGNAAMLILGLLFRRDMYGYEMLEELRSRSQNVFEMKAGTLYPLLHSLEEKGYVTVYKQAAGEGAQKVRKYYHVTKKGKKVLEQKRTEWDVYARAVANVLGVKTAKGEGGMAIDVASDLFSSGFKPMGGIL